MTTQAVMKARIADDITRSDLDTQIEEAITTAIEAYQHVRFWFNETRDATFSTVVAQRIYTEDDADFIPNVLKIDFLTVELGATDVRFLKRVSPAEMEDQVENTTTSGQPFDYSYYDQSFHLYPIPSEIWTVRMHGQAFKAAPASDTEANNVWMVEAARLIRSRAKYELAVHVLQNGELAIAMSPDAPPQGTKGGHETYRSFKDLKGRTSRQVGSGKIVPYD